MFLFVCCPQDFRTTFDGKNARLEIFDVYPEDSGNYTCCAENTEGEAQTYCTLHVQETPDEVFVYGDTATNQSVKEETNEVANQTSNQATLVIPDSRETSAVDTGLSYEIGHQYEFLVDVPKHSTSDQRCLEDKDDDQVQEYVESPHYYQSTVYSSPPPKQHELSIDDDENKNCGMRYDSPAPVSSLSENTASRNDRNQDGDQNTMANVSYETTNAHKTNNPPENEPVYKPVRQTATAEFFIANPANVDDHNASSHSEMAFNIPIRFAGSEVSASERREVQQMTRDVVAPSLEVANTKYPQASTYSGEIEGGSSNYKYTSIGQQADNNRARRTEGDTISMQEGNYDNERRYGGRETTYKDNYKSDSQMDNERAQMDNERDRKRVLSKVNIGYLSKADKGVEYKLLEMQDQRNTTGGSYPQPQNTPFEGNKRNDNRRREYARMNLINKLPTSKGAQSDTFKHNPFLQADKEQKSEPTSTFRSSDNKSHSGNQGANSRQALTSRYSSTAPAQSNQVQPSRVGLRSVGSERSVSVGSPISGNPPRFQSDSRGSSVTNSPRLQDTRTTMTQKTSLSRYSPHHEHHLQLPKDGDHHRDDASDSTSGISSSDESKGELRLLSGSVFDDTSPRKYDPQKDDFKGEHRVQSRPLSGSVFVDDTPKYDPRKDSEQVHKEWRSNTSLHGPEHDPQYVSNTTSKFEELKRTFSRDSSQNPSGASTPTGQRHSRTDLSDLNQGKSQLASWQSREHITPKTFDNLKSKFSVEIDDKKGKVVHTQVSQHPVQRLRSSEDSTWIKPPQTSYRDNAINKEKSNGKLSSWRSSEQIQGVKNLREKFAMNPDADEDQVRRASVTAVMSASWRTADPSITQDGITRVFDRDIDDKQKDRIAGRISSYGARSYGTLPAKFRKSEDDDKPVEEANQKSESNVYKPISRNDRKSESDISSRRNQTVKSPALPSTQYSFSAVQSKQQSLSALSSKQYTPSAVPSKQNTPSASRLMTTAPRDEQVVPIAARGVPAPALIRRDQRSSSVSSGSSASSSQHRSHSIPSTSEQTSEEPRYQRPISMFELQPSSYSSSRSGSEERKTEPGISPRYIPREERQEDEKMSESARYIPREEPNRQEARYIPKEPEESPFEEKSKRPSTTYYEEKQRRAIFSAFGAKSRQQKDQPPKVPDSDPPPLPSAPPPMETPTLLSQPNKAPASQPTRQQPVRKPVTQPIIQQVQQTFTQPNKPEAPRTYEHGRDSRYERTDAHTSIVRQKVRDGLINQPANQPQPLSQPARIAATSQSVRYTSREPRESQDQPTRQPAMHVMKFQADESKRKPVIEPVPQPVREPTPEPIREPTPEPVREPTPEPIREPTPEPVREPIPEPVREPTPEPIREPTPEPVREPTPEPVRELTPEPVREPTPEPVREPTTELESLPSEQPNAHSRPRGEEHIFEEISFKPIAKTRFGSQFSRSQDEDEEPSKGLSTAKRLSMRLKQLSYMEDDDDDIFKPPTRSQTVAHDEDLKEPKDMYVKKEDDDVKEDLVDSYTHEEQREYESDVKEYSTDELEQTEIYESNDEPVEIEYEEQREEDYESNEELEKQMESSDHEEQEYEEEEITQEEEYEVQEEYHEGEEEEEEVHEDDHQDYDEEGEYTDEEQDQRAYEGYSDEEHEGKILFHPMFQPLYDNEAKGQVVHFKRFNIVM